MSLLEFYKLVKNDNINPQTYFGLLIAVILFLPTLLYSGFGIPLDLFPLLIVLPFFVFIRELYSKAVKPFTNIAYTLLGTLYLSLPLFLFYLLSLHGENGYDYHIILGFFFLLWSSDTGAYFAGKFLGKHKLFERISPKKTWEGFFGGMAFALLVAVLLSKYFIVFSLTKWIIVALIIIVAGALGDLVESLFKRSIQIKDSGAILPGHGGFLDRFDGLFIAAPFVYLYLQYCQ